MSTPLEDETKWLLVRMRWGDQDARKELQRYAKFPELVERIGAWDAAVLEISKEFSRAPLGTLIDIVVHSADFDEPSPLQAANRRDRCTVCERPALSGDSLCYTHNR